MTHDEIYRTRHRVAERGNKPGYYLVVSRSFIAGNDDVSTVVCAPIYSEILGIATEVIVGPEDGVPRRSAVRCDFLMLMSKAKLTAFVGSLSASKTLQMNGALSIALDISRA